MGGLADGLDLAVADPALEVHEPDLKEEDQGVQGRNDTQGEERPEGGEVLGREAEFRGWGA